MDILLMRLYGLQAKAMDESCPHQIGQPGQACDAYVVVDAHRVLVARQDPEPVHRHEVAQLRERGASPSNQLGWRLTESARAI